MGSRMSQEIIFGLFSFARKMILHWGGGGGGGCKLPVRPAPTSFPQYLGRSSWYQIYGLFRYATDDQPETTPEKLLSPQKIEKKNF